jgi:hypothetical protein
MMQWFRRSLVVALLALAASAAGCFGRFRVVSAVYEFNRSVENKFVRSLVMVAMIVIPVYGVAALADVLVFNLIEFWGGNAALGTRTLPDGTQVQFARISPELLRIRVTSAQGRTEELEVVKIGQTAGYLRRPGGPILMAVEQTADGQIVARDTAGQEVPVSSYFSSYLSTSTSP